MVNKYVIFCAISVNLSMLGVVLGVTYNGASRICRREAERDADFQANKQKHANCATGALFPCVVAAIEFSCLPRYRCSLGPRGNRGPTPYFYSTGH